MHNQAEKNMPEPVCDKNDIVKNECSVSLALKILGKKWTFLILCELLLNHELYFSQLQKSMIGPDGENISARVLSECLSRLELDHGIILRTVHSDEMPIHVSYSLTEKGEDFTVIFSVLKGWGTKWGDLKVKKCRSFSCIHNAVPIIDLDEAKKLYYIQSQKEEKLG